MSVRDWFGEWHRLHVQKHPNRNWVPFDGPDGGVYYDGWIAAFEEKGITEPEALEASTYLQRDAPGFPDRHLKAILGCVEIVRQRLRDAAAAGGATALAPGQAEAQDRSADCPECHGTGWARRYARAGDFPLPYPVELYCRCPYGTWREIHRGPEHRTRFGQWMYESLQALPEVWDRTLSYPNWDAEPSEPIMGDDQRCTHLPAGTTYPLTAAERHARLRELAAGQLRSARRPRRDEPKGPDAH